MSMQVRTALVQLDPDTTGGRELALRLEAASSNGFGVVSGSNRTPEPGSEVKAAAATVAIRLRNTPTSPTPSGCKRLERKMTYEFDVGSIHRLVPVNPVWPYDVPTGNRSPRLLENVVSMSHPKPRTLRMPAGVCGDVIIATLASESTRVAPSRPFPSNIRANNFRSRAVLNSPACPAIPPIRRAVGSWTMPRSGGASGCLHGVASIVLQRSVGAIRGSSVLEGRNPVSVIPSGTNTRARKYASSDWPVTRETMSPSRK